MKPAVNLFSSFIIIIIVIIIIIITLWSGEFYVYILRAGKITHKYYVTFKKKKILRWHVPEFESITLDNINAILLFYRDV